MLEWVVIYSDLLSNIFLFLTLDLFVNTFATTISPQKLHFIKKSFLLAWSILSILPSISFFSLIMLLLNIIYIFLISTGTIRLRIWIFIKYEIYYYLGSAVIAILHTILTLDIHIYGTNSIYADFVSIIGSFLLYIILSMYIILRKLSDFPSGKTYKRYFLAITGVIILLLIASSMLFGSTILEQQDIAPFIFTLLLIIALLCISIYHKVITILNENALTKIESEKNALQQDYYAHVKENLKNISLLRHDFKNHLLIIQEYATQDKKEELLSYIGTLYDGLTPNALIETPSALLSSLINAKNEDCKVKGITLHFSYDFKAIHIDDFHLVTIMSNLLDNAITAAAKADTKEIKLRIEEMNSFLTIDCVNYHNEQIEERNQIFFTTKTTQKEIHGLGIKSMRKAVDTLNGQIHIDYTENTFHVTILLPNY